MAGICCRLQIEPRAYHISIELQALPAILLPSIPGNPFQVPLAPHIRQSNQYPPQSPKIRQLDLTLARITTQYVDLLFFFLQYVVYFVDKTFLGLYRKKIRILAEKKNPD